MISNSLELKTTHDSNVAVEELVNALTKEIEAPAITKCEEELQRNPLALGTTYSRILEAGGHLGC